MSCSSRERRSDIYFWRASSRSEAVQNPHCLMNSGANSSLTGIWNNSDLFVSGLNLAGSKSL